MIKAVIVDDEINGRENLRGVLETHFPEVNVIQEASSAVEAIKCIEIHKPDLVFLDIEMPGGNGFEVLNYFTQPDFQVIFVTAYDHFAIQALRFSALDYILKPINVLQLKASLKRYVEQEDEWNRRLEVFLKNHSTASNEKKIALTFSDKIDFVQVKKIIKCKGEGGYTRIFLEEGLEVLTSKSLVEYEELLNEFGFIRTHKAYLVNISHVVSFVKTEGGYLVMSDNSQTPVSRRKKDEVLVRLKM